MKRKDSNINDYSLKLLENYLFLINNLSDQDKIKIIAKISNSLVNKNKQTKHFVDKKKKLKETYGSFISNKTADEIIEDIYDSRHFSNKDLSI